EVITEEVKNIEPEVVTPPEPVIEPVIQEELVKVEEKTPEEIKFESNNFIVHKATIDNDIDNSMIKKIIMGCCALAFLIVLVIIASFSNMSKYYIISNDKGIEIWRGSFSPLGKEFFMQLNDVKIPENKKKDVYCKADVFPLICENYISKADNVLDVAGIPNFKTMKKHLNKAIPYAISKELSDSISNRSDRLDAFILIYKADILVLKGSIPNFEQALNYLKQALNLNIDELQKDLVLKKIKVVSDILASTKGKK
ncbi:MAG: hypothetical protein HQK78_11770, partial [Desulfobacterales bacterium]|nr:hypothetical protein [Desulfobacterales bacterium]